MKELYQKHWPDFRRYQIKDDGVQIEIKNQSSYTSQLIQFEKLGIEEIIIKHKPNPYEIGFFFSLLVNILFCIITILQDYKLSDGLITGISFALILPFSFWGSRIFKFQKEKYLSGENISLPFYYFNKEQKDVDLFIEEIKFTRKNYMRNKFMKVDDITPSESLKLTFQWLYQLKIISEIEYKNLLDQLEERKIIKGE